MEELLARRDFYRASDSALVRTAAEYGHAYALLKGYGSSSVLEVRAQLEREMQRLKHELDARGLETLAAASALDETSASLR